MFYKKFYESLYLYKYDAPFPDRAVPLLSRLLKQPPLPQLLLNYDMMMMWPILIGGFLKKMYIMNYLKKKQLMLFSLLMSMINSLSTTY